MKKDMTVEERKKELYNYLAQLEEQIEILKCNIDEFKKIVENIQSEDDFNKHMNFDLEKGLSLIELY